MRIGLDLDNTIIDYDRVFAKVAEERGWLAAAAGAGLSKRQVRDAIRAQPDGETRWMMLQGQVYGAYLPLAEPYAGMKTAVLWLAAQPGIELYIVSHKTRRGHFDERRVDLHEAARGWLSDQGLVGAGGPIAPRNLYFEETRSAKIERIAALRLEAFVDDLEEVLIDPGFPQTTAKLWFTLEAPQDIITGLLPFRSWGEIGGWFQERFDAR